jgi:CheY-like chemotaxis protein
MDVNVPGCRTILVAEDEPVVLKMTTRMLERLGYVVLAASTPSLAIRISKESDTKIDLVISDVIMPEMNGRELVERLLENRPGVKYLYMSGYTANVIANQGVLDEGTFFLQKPFSPKELAAKVLEVFETE